MPMNFLGKVAFPRLAPWQRKRQVKIMLTAFVTAVIFAVVVVAIMFLQNSKR